MIRKCVAVFLFLASVSLVQSQMAMQSWSSVPAARLAQIRHGINLSEWFAQVYDPKGYTKGHFESWTTASDIALIKSAGFDHVRLSVNPQPMMDAMRRHDGSADREQQRVLSLAGRPRTGSVRQDSVDLSRGLRG